MGESFRQILGINFFAGETDELLRLTDQGGLVVVPSAPVLVDLELDSAHRTALEKSDLALTDSGFMVLLWRLFNREHLPRISGLKYLRALLNHAGFREPGATFWIMPSEEDARANLAWLAEQGIEVPVENVYVAPFYPSGALRDPDLLDTIEDRQPKYIITALGGGVQERLGYYLRQNLSAFAPDDGRPMTEDGIKQLSAISPPSTAPGRPAIICTGAAIAFLSGGQTNIPPWADRLMLGWFLRILSSPTRYFPRYWKALHLVPLLWRHGSESCAQAAVRSLAPAKDLSELAVEAEAVEIEADSATP